MRLLTLVLTILASSAAADDRQTLIQSIENAGTHEYQDERRSVLIDGCKMTTFRWRLRPDHGWVLWTSFQFNMQDAVINQDRRTPGKMYAFGVTDPGPPEIGFALVGFTMQDGTTARQERSVLREPSSETEPSPRGDGTTHYFQELSEFIIHLEGPALEAKVIAFTEGYHRYAAEYCGETS